jgi:chromosome segregation protein
MRLKELNLLAYGKFTDCELQFPRSEHDFHVIIGPNEAGKSTVRRAIRELLFGMERQSPLGFLHPQSDLKLKAVLEAAIGKLEFIRTKQQKSLRSLADEPLPDGYLAAALGSLSEEAFIHLHCLDHTALVKGGRGIVDPSTTVSQMLFQAASGLESFAAVRDILRERSAELFTARGKKGDYGAASERLAIAQKMLKEVQVRSKDWVQASEAVDSARSALRTERAKRAELEQLRSAWERSRRLGSRIEQYDEVLQELSELGDTLAFPANAKATLEQGITELNTAAGITQTRESDVQARQEELAALQLDEAVTDLTAEVAQLAQLCSQCLKYPTDIVSRKSEVQLWLREALAQAKQFGWGESEEEIRSRVPQDKVLRTLESLLKERGGLIEAERGANETQNRQQQTLDAVNQKLQDLDDSSYDPAVEVALDQALPYKSSAIKERTLRAAAETAKTKLSNALTALGRPALAVDKLRQLQLPSRERVTSIKAARQEIASQLSLRKSRAEESQLSAQALELQVCQFEAGNKVVTAAEVGVARKERDSVWGDIKAGALALADGAPRLDANLRLADELADARTLSESAAASLQGLRDQHQAAKEQAESHATLTEDKQRELDQFDATWTAQTTQWGIDGLELEDMHDWLAKRDAVLAAADELQGKESELRLEQDAATDAGKALAAAMATAGIEVAQNTGLAQMAARAEEHVEEAKTQRVTKQGLMQQQDDAKVALEQAKQAVTTKTEAVTQWNGRWSAALAMANLQGTDTAEVEAAIYAGREIRQLLAKVDDHRVSRIDMMEAELELLGNTARELAQELGPELLQGKPQEISQALTTRLQRARAQADKHTSATNALDEAQRLFKEAKTRTEVVKKAMGPVLQLAQVEDPLLAVPLVEKADRRRHLQQEVHSAKLAIERDSDALSLDKLRLELQEHPPVESPGKIQDIKDRLEESDRTMTQLVQTELTARQVFEAIDGSEKAAVAEAQRQEAIADMSTAGEEYVQLTTASTLLKWAVDRYRDRKQGPLLERASSIFESLTIGSFRKLRIDYDQTPPALLAYRSEGAPVKVEGLSDGTRDQLFLALRIAALELQSEQGERVPFIADDLFINFDDERSKAGLKALWHMSTRTQVMFLSHQEHLIPVVESLFPQVNVVRLEGVELPI